MGLVYGVSLGDGEIRYVGMTTADLERREYEHRIHARIYGRTPIHLWLRKHEDAVFEVLEDDVPDDALDEQERFWIKLYRDSGHRLLNCTDGGRTACVLNDDTRQRMSQSTKGAVPGSEHYRKFREGQLKWVRSPEGRARMSEVKSGENHHFYGKPWTSERRDKVMNQKMKAYGWTVEDVRYVRAAKSNGIPFKDLAVKYNVDPSTISKIANRKKWDWVP